MAEQQHISDPQFYQDMIDFFRRKKSSHMSPHLYAHHEGMADGEPISGALMWHYAATREEKYYIARSDIELLQQTVNEIKPLVPHGLPLVDLGPGSLKAVENKSLKLLNALESSYYQPLDCSEMFTHDAEKYIAEHAPSVISAGKVVDFLSPQAHHDFEDDVVMYYGGATISNLIHPMTDVFPYHVLIEEMETLARLTKRGWLLISYDAIQDEKRVLEAYRTKYFSRFIRNILYRAAVELPTRNFNPDGFACEPEWIPSAHLLANIIVATEDQNFWIGSENFQVSRGEKFLVLNSYKFTSKIFEACCVQAGYEIKQKWEHSTPMELYLLKVDEASEIVSVPATQVVAA